MNRSSTFVQWSQRWFWASFILVIAVVSCFHHIRIDTGFRAFFQHDDERLRALDAIETRYGALDGAVFVVVAQQGDLFTADRQKLLASLTDQINTNPYVITTSSFSTANRSRFVENEIVITPWIDSENPSNTDWQSLKQAALQDPMLRQRLFNETGTATVILARTAPELEQPAAIAQFVNTIEDLQKNLNSADSALQLHVLGQPLVNHSLVTLMKRDAITLMPITLFVGTLVIWLLLRSMGGLVAGMFTIGAAMVLTFGISAAAQWQFNQISIMAFLLVFIVSMADCIHLSTSYFHHVLLGEPPETAMQHAIEHNRRAIFLTSITTVIGFLGLTMASSPPFRVLGGVGALGIAIAYVFTFTIQPYLLLKFARRSHIRPDIYSRPMGVLAEYVIRHRRAIIAGAVLVTLACIPLISKNRFNNDPLDYFDSNMPVRQAIDAYNQAFNGSTVLALSLDSEQSGGVYEPAYLQKIEQLQGWLHAQPHVSSTFSLLDVIGDLHQQNQQNSGLTTPYPQTRAEVTDLVTLYEMSMADNAAFRRLLSDDASSMRMDIRFDTSDNLTLVEFEKQLNAQLKQQGQAGTLSGHALVFSHLGLDVISNMLAGSALTFIAIALCLVIGFRSWLFGIMTLIPNNMPAFIVYGLWGLLNGTMDVAASTTFCISMGIVVDDSIHVVTQYLRSRRAGRSPEEAVRDILGQTGLAIIVTSLVLMAGLLVLGFSWFQPNVTLSVMTTMIIGVALILELIMVPALLIEADHWFRPFQRHEILAINTRAFQKEH